MAPLGSLVVIMAQMGLYLMEVLEDLILVITLVLEEEEEEDIMEEVEEEVIVFHLALLEVEVEVEGQVWSLLVQLVPQITILEMDT